MKKQINPTIKAHLTRGAFYLLLLVTVCAIPFVLAQPYSRVAAKQKAATSANAARLQGAFSTAVMANNLLRHTITKRIHPYIKGNAPLVTYAIDDGTAEDSVGLTNGGNLLCLNSFPVSGGNNMITSISIAWGTPVAPDPSLNGLSYTVVLWSDPNNDGSPTDAVVLATANDVIANANTDTFITTNITPTVVASQNFFVGFVLSQTAGQFPAAFDETAPLPMRSWVSIGGNINNLSDAQPIEVATGGQLVGNWLIRAEGVPGGTPSPTPTATCGPGYTTTTGSGVITPGGTDVGNHCDDCTTDITLPFPVSVYGGAPVTDVAVGSDGDIHFPGPYNKLFWWPGCVPVDPGTGQDPFLNTLFPNYADLVTDETAGPCPDCGIFTQTLGSAPNRQFIIRWKANYFNSPPGPAQAEFEVLLTEGSNTLSVIYGQTGDNGLTAVSGIQQDLTTFTSFSCNEATLTPGLRVDYVPTTCGSPTPTPTATATATPTATAAPRSTPTPRPRPSGPPPRP